MQRRSLLKLGLASGAALALAGAGAVWLSAPSWQAGRLLPAGRSVVRAVARAVLDGSWPDTGVALAQVLDEHLLRMELTVAALAPSMQAEVADLFSLLATAPGRIALAGLATPWDEATLGAVQQALQSMRVSRLTLRRQAYHALRDLTLATHFANARTWPQLGYPGPLKIG
jgi:hypothetical protein